jgi:hypothetical protein
MDSDVIGGFPITSLNCQGCNKPLELNNAWMTDGCPCNSSLGCNNQNETRWRLLMQLQQNQSHRITELEAEKASGVSGTDPRCCDHGFVDKTPADWEHLEAQLAEAKQQLATFEAEHYNDQIDHGVNQK